MTYATPPNTETEGGAARRVGVEIEFAGLPGPAAADVLKASVGGRVVERGVHRYAIEGTALGDLSLEIDTRFAHSKSPQDESQLVETAREVFGNVAQLVVPYEVITPPLALDDLPRIDAVVEGLRDAGAKGTAANPLYAFGVHLNPEACSLRPDYLLQIMRAFTLLNDDLRAAIRPDASRRLIGWAAPYSDEYSDRILSEGYAPSLSQLIRDYVHSNPGRNYDLDMLPLFAEADESLTNSLVGDMLSSPRPAFHYRLPDCRIDEPGWSLAKEWNRWVEVERLADDADRFAALRRDWLRARHDVAVIAD